MSSSGAGGTVSTVIHFQQATFIQTSTSSLTTLAQFYASYIVGKVTHLFYFHLFSVLINQQRKKS